MTTIRPKLIAAVLAATTAITGTAAVATGVAAHRADERATTSERHVEELAADLDVLRVEVATEGDPYMRSKARAVDYGDVLHFQRLAAVNPEDLLWEEDRDNPDREQVRRWGVFPGGGGYDYIQCRDGYQIAPSVARSSAHRDDPATFTHPRYLSVTPGDVCIPAE